MKSLYYGLIIVFWVDYLEFIIQFYYDIVYRTVVAALVRALGVTDCKNLNLKTLWSLWRSGGIGSPNLKVSLNPWPGVCCLSSGLSSPNITLYGRQWIFGSVYCSINSFTSSLTVSVSVFTLLALTIERYKVRSGSQLASCLHVF